MWGDIYNQKFCIYFKNKTIDFSKFNNNFTIK